MTRDDLTPAHQAVQSAHAALTFATEHPTIVRRWHFSSNYLIVLSVPDEYALESLASRVESLGLTYTEFREPDFGDALTAIVISPSPMTEKLVANLPLALRESEPAMV